MAKFTQKSPQNRHIRPPFSPFYLRKCLNNSGRYILSQGTEENSNAICSLPQMPKFRGHRQLECPTKVSHSKDHKSLTPVARVPRRLLQIWWLSLIKMVNRLLCVNVERPRSSENSKKSNFDRLTSNDGTIYTLLAVPRVMMVRSTIVDVQG